MGIHDISPISWRVDESSGISVAGKLSTMFGEASKPFARRNIRVGAAI